MKTNTNGGTVLVVDDDAAVRKLAARILDRQGFRVLEAEDGEEALGAARSADRVDLLLSDLVLPRLNGEDLARRLRSASPGLPVIFMSGFGQDELESMGIRTVGAAYMAKPFTADVLALMVRGALNR